MSTGLAAGLRPGLAALRRRDLPAVRGDVLAGITVAAYLVPQVLAYAEVAGLAAVTGLWTAVAALGAYVVFGSSRQLSVGPESTTAIMTAVALAPLASGDGGRYAALAGALALLVGAICLLGRLARLGFLADLLSRPVLVGYLTGIALIMISGQLEKITGVPVDGDTFAAELLSFAASIGRVHLPTVLLAVAVLAFLLIGAKLFPRAPIPLLAVLLAAGATALLTADALGVRVVGSVPQGIPLPALPSVTLTDLTDLLLPAIGVAIVAYSDNVLTGRAFATRNSHPLDADQEMLALGAANVAAGLLQGFPVSSSGSRTVIGDSLGSRSQLSSIVTLLLVVVVLFVGGPVLAAFPTTALGALVVYAALRLIEPAEFRRFARFRRSELALAVATTIAVLVLGVLYGVLAAVALSILDLLRRVSRPHAAVLGFVPGLAGMHDRRPPPRQAAAGPDQTAPPPSPPPPHRCATARGRSPGEDAPDAERPRPHPSARPATRCPSRRSRRPPVSAGAASDSLHERRLRRFRRYRTAATSSSGTWMAGMLRANQAGR
jgi:SulP family sulfate permease